MYVDDAPRLKDPGKALALSYILALSLIAVLTVFGHGLMFRIIEQQKNTAEIVYVAGRQRMLAQQMAQFASRYNRLGREDDREKMKVAIERFEKGHRFLTRMSMGDENDIRPMSPPINEIYYNEPFNLDQTVRAYIDNARVYASYHYKSPDSTRIQVLNYISEQSTGLLPEALDQAMQAYQDEADVEILQMERWQLGGGLFVLFVLLCEALFVFRPMVRYVNRYTKIIAESALRDPLTGLYNRRALEDSQRRALAAPGCVVMADIDRFKAINDGYGHDVGDRVLRHFAQLMGRALRESDMIVRMGGEEFALLLPSTTVDAGMSIIERLRHTVEATPCGYAAPDGSGRELTLAYTASFGLVAFTEVPIDLDS
ncbi:MAG: diguanylate cyclase, partial [Alphaproteobacteria bacterium]|nr:diguanylate cyclase [Alphaproteobacteria bacterium]